MAKKPCILLVFSILMLQNKDYLRIHNLSEYQRDSGESQYTDLRFSCSHMIFLSISIKLESDSNINAYDQDILSYTNLRINVQNGYCPQEYVSLMKVATYLTLFAFAFLPFRLLNAEP